MKNVDMSAKGGSAFGGENKNKEIKILLLGLAMILAVFAITVAKSGLFSSEKNKSGDKSEGLNLSYRTISPQDLQLKILNKEALSLVDIRGFQDYANEHLTDSINIPPDNFPVSAKTDIHKPAVIIAQNSSDENIQKVVEDLEQASVSDVKVLAGGMDAWKELIGNTVTFGNPESFVDQTKVSYMTADELKKYLETDDSPFVLDVRTGEEYSGGHVPGAVNIPFEDIEKRRDEIPTNRSLALVGIGELQEFQAAVQIYDLKLITPFVVKGAMTEWTKKNYPIEKQ